MLTRPAVDLFIRTKFSDWPGAIDALDKQFLDSLSPVNVSIAFILGRMAGDLSA